MKIIKEKNTLKGTGPSLAVMAKHWETLADNEEAADAREAERARIAAASRAEAAPVAAPDERALTLTSGHRAKLAQAETLRRRAAALRALATGKVGKGRNKVQRAQIRNADKMLGDAMVLVREVEAERLALTEQRALMGSVSVTEKLAKLREEEPETETVRAGAFVRDRHGAVLRRRNGEADIVNTTVERLRIKGRDGLELLLSGKSPALTPILGEAGAKYRDLIELVGSDLRSQLGGEGSGGGDIEAFHLARAKAGQVRVEIEGRVQRDAGAAALAALRKVAGEGQSVRSIIGDSRRPTIRYIAELRKALTIAARVLKLRYPDHIWRCDELGSEARPHAEGRRDERLVYVTADGDHLFEAVRKVRRPA